MNKIKLKNDLHVDQMNEMLDVKQAAIYLGISKSLLYKLTSTRAITFTKPNNGKIYFKKSNLDKWMQKNEFTDLNQKKDEIFNHSK